MKRLFIAMLLIVSVTTAFTQTINKAEYFFDTDPGPGGGTDIPISNPGPTVNFPVSIPGNLSPGFHRLAIRVRDSDGKWSLFSNRNFFVSQATSDLPIITRAEYFYDTDPGAGNGAPLTIQASGFSIAQNFTIPVPSTLSAGTHRLAIRVRDQAGHWSLFQRDTISVSGVAATISCPANVEVNSLPNLCYAIVNNIDPITSPGGLAYTYTLSGATTGTGNGSASGLHFGTGVTTVTYALTNSPAINSSFTVTVKTTPSVSISLPTTVECGSTVNFVAVATNAGSNASYQWKVNGVNVGTNSPTYVDTAVANGDNITVVLTSSLSCASPSTATSSPVVMTTTGVTPAVTVTASTTTPCYGQAVTFTANPVYGGANPVYTWRINNNINNFGGGATFQSSLQDGDSVSVQMHSSDGCASVSDVQSSWVVMHVTPSLMQNLSINASATSICQGQTVTFTAVPENASNPVYQWTLNGNNVGTNSSTYQNSSLANHDTVQLSMTSSGCVIPQTVNSNAIVMNVTGAGIPSVIIDVPSTSICSGQQVTFTATPTNGGANPTYEWILNNNAVGTNSNIFQSSTLQNGDKVKVTMVPSQTCGNNFQVVSNTITMTVGAEVTPSVSMSSSADRICAGTLVTFHASPISGAGSTPAYQWKLNGNNIPGATNSTYQSSSLSNGDVLRVAMTSSLGCANPQTVLSHDSVTMEVSSIALVPSVNIVSTANVICEGDTVTFTAIPTNGGLVPGYQWKRNGNNVGPNDEVYSTSLLQNGDVITVEMFTSVTCATTPSTTSDPVTITIGQLKIFYADFDGDGFGNGASGVTEECAAPLGYVISNGDCDDSNSAVHPGAAEICGNSIDDDCDGQTDETCTSPDNDNDGYTVAQGDCNDNNAAIYPGAAEACGNNIDDDCDGQADEGCNESLPVMTLRTYPIKEGDAGQTVLNVEVTLDIPAPLPITVHYSTSNEDAIAGSDYVATSGLLLIPAGATSGSVQVRIIGDLLKESNERFRLNFTNPVNVVLIGDPYSRIMIIDDDKGKVTSTSAQIDGAPVKEEVFRIPTVTKRNQVWMIPQIANYENEVLIVNLQGQTINKFVNYKNQTPVGNVAAGLYFYRIRVAESPGKFKYYTGRLLITE